MEQNGSNHEALWKKQHLCLIFQKHIFLTVNLIQGQGDM